MINIARLTKRVAPVSEGISWSIAIRSTAVVGIAQTIMPAPVHAAVFVLRGV